MCPRNLENIEPQGGGPISTLSTPPQFRDLLQFQINMGPPCNLQEIVLL